MPYEHLQTCKQHVITSVMGHCVESFRMSTQTHCFLSQTGNSVPMVIVYMPWENDQYVDPYLCKQTSYIKVIPILHDVRIRSQFKWGDPEQTK